MNHFFAYPHDSKGYIVYTIAEISAYSTTEYQFKIPTKLSPKEWDNVLERPKNIYNKKQKEFFVCLNEIKITVAAYIEDKQKQKTPVSKMAVTKTINKIIENKAPHKVEKNTLLFYTQQYITLRKNFVQKNTFWRYNVFQRLLQMFEGSLCQRFLLKDVNQNFVVDFINFCKQENYSENTIYRSLNFYKTILNFAETKGVKTPVRELNIKREKQHRELVTLDEEELQLIQQTHVPEELEDAKDWLLISCYTGQRVSDFMNFTTDKLAKVGGKQCITFQQQKTKKQIVLPLHPVVKQIIKKRKAFPKKLTVTQYNKSIKQIAELSGITKEIITNKRVNFRIKKASIEKYKTLSSHIGRRSFATLFYGKIPTSILMMATGHSSENTLLKYIDQQNTDKIKYLSSFFEKSYKKGNRG